MQQIQTKVKACGAMFIYDGGRCFVLESKVLPTMATSTMDANYISKGNAAREALWLHKLMETLFVTVIKVQMYCDSSGAVGQMHTNNQC
jgi:hypothetical protein